LSGLVEHYGFAASPDGTAYFELHAERDHEHAAQSKAVLADAPNDDADRLVAAAEAALVGNWRLLDGVSSS
jgi:pyrroloquinoline quinone (PQQ) biosynthesis protein C